MVARVFVRTVCATFTLVSVLTAPAKSPGDYNVGDRAQEDILTPVRLDVVDPAATAQLKEQVSEKVPAVFRFYPGAGAEAVAAFKTTFAKTRRDFLDAVESKFQNRQLSTNELASDGFKNLAESFQKHNVLFPVDLDLAMKWAGGDLGEDGEELLVSRLINSMKQFIRSDDPAPPEAKVGSTARLISFADTEELTPELVAERGTDVHKTDFISLPRAKQNLENLFSSADQGLAKYLASFVKPDCFLEVELTAQMRNDRTKDVVASDHYKPNDVIVKRGEIIDAKIKAALDALQEALPATPAPVVASAPAPADSAWTAREIQWLVGALAAALLILAVAIWHLARRRDVNSMLPVRTNGDAMPMVPPDHGASNDWKRRALAAEQRVQDAQAAARAGLLSHFARWASDKLTQRLVSQRNELLNAHQKAAVEMAELEARLEKVQAPLQERLKAYEQRIQDLEKELAAKGEENRELIKVKIEIVRKQLEIERGRNRLEYN